jgi:hypothetical protein
MQLLGAVQFGKLVGGLQLQVLITLIGVIGLCVVFLLVQYLHISLNPDRKKPILNPKIGEPVMQSLTEGIKFVQ